MKKKIVIVVLALVGAVAIGYVGYVVGATSGGTMAARSANKDSLAYFTSIHKALEAEKYERAKHTVETAVDGHVGVLRLLDSKRKSRLHYAWPWSAIKPAEEARQKVMKNAKQHFLTTPGTLETETVEFLKTMSVANKEG